MVETAGLHFGADPLERPLRPRGISHSQRICRRGRFFPGLYHDFPHLKCGYVHDIFMIWNDLPKVVGIWGFSEPESREKKKKHPRPGRSPGNWNLRRQLQRPLGTTGSWYGHPDISINFWNPHPSNDWWLYDVICSNGLGLLVNIDDFPLKPFDYDNHQPPDIPWGVHSQNPQPFLIRCRCRFHCMALGPENFQEAVGESPGSI